MKDETIGLSEMSQTAVRCGDCGIRLVNVVITESNESRISRGLEILKNQFVITNCYKCGGKSFKSQIFEGSLVIGTFKDDLKLECLDTEYDNGILVSILEVKK